MESVYLFSVVNQQQSWLSTRQSIVSQNVANANTPGFRSLDLAPFSTTLDSSAIQMSSSNPAHFSSASLDQYPLTQKQSDIWETTHSGNSVALESEMIKAGDIRTAFSLNASIMKAFHGMWLSSLKG